MVEIELYKPAYKNDFIRLNREWIETYFKIEASDIETFSHVDEIIEQGGQIFIALYNGEVAGCCAIKYHDEKTILCVNFFHLEDCGKILVRGVKEKGDIKNANALKEAFSLGTSI